MKACTLLLSALLCRLICSAQTNVALLHQLVDNNKSEYSRQITLRDKHATSSALEELNLNQTKRLKNTYQDLKKKFSTVGMAMEGLQIGLEALPVLKQISADQLTIVFICQSRPVLAVLAVDTQTELVDRAQLLLRYIYGLALSSGNLGAMSRSDRAMLTDFVVTELKSISLLLSGLKKSLKALNSRDAKTTAGFMDMLQRDKQISQDILLKVKQLKKK